VIFGDTVADPPLPHKVSRIIWMAPNNTANKIPIIFLQTKTWSLIALFLFLSFEKTVLLLFSVSLYESI
jgi:hypothetical protein